jgi:hypothetical protein
MAAKIFAKALCLEKPGKRYRMSDQFGPVDTRQRPRETPPGTWRLAALSAVCAAVLVGIGAYLTDVHHAGGALVLVIGAVGLLLSFAVVPVARRRAAKGLPSYSPDLPTWLRIISPSLITPGVVDAFNHQFGISSIVFIVVGCAVYVAAACIPVSRRRRRRTARIERS